MGIIGRLTGVLRGAAHRQDERAAPFRCLSCGHGQDREYNSCPDCGGSFVVPADGDPASDEAEPPWR